MTSGVYKLLFDDKAYIGRSQNIEQRFTGHISDIKLGKSSKKLISAYETYGGPSLTILVVEPNLSLQKVLEVEYIKALDTVNNGLNTTYGGEDILFGELNANSKYSNAQIHKVLTLLAQNKDLTIKEISLVTGVSVAVIKDISAQKRHILLSIEYPEEYAMMVANKEHRLKRSISNLTDTHQFKSTLNKFPTLLSPNGSIVDIEGSLSSFALKNNLQVGNLSSLIHGRRKSHKGWRIAPER